MLHLAVTWLVQPVELIATSTNVGTEAQTASAKMAACDRMVTASDHYGRKSGGENVPMVTQ